MVKRSFASGFAMFKSEQAGAVILFLIALILAVIPRIFLQQKPADKAAFPYDSAAVARLLYDQELYIDSIFGNQGKRKSFKYLSARQLVSLGFTPEAAKRIEQARKKGTHFESISDIARVSGMDSAKIAGIIQPPGNRGYEKSYAETTILELNTADTSALKKLPGIGSKTAKRIIEYREKLGGFFETRQILEVWYTDSNVLKGLFPRFTTDPEKIKKINLSNCREETLSTHPYISKSQAKILMAWIREHGIPDYAAFMKIKGFKESDRNRLIPYLFTN